MEEVDQEAVDRTFWDKKSGCVWLWKKLYPSASDESRQVKLYFS